LFDNQLKQRNVNGVFKFEGLHMRKEHFKISGELV